MKKPLPAYARQIPTAMGPADRGATCGHCARAVDVWDYYYPGRKRSLCRPCATLFGAGTRWEYVGGGSIREITRTR